MPKLSVIIPIYNAEQYIVSCLDSLMAQTFLEYEVLLVDEMMAAHMHNTELHAENGWEPIDN